jgi:hypothetical protein
MTGFSSLSEPSNPILLPLSPSSSHPMTLISSSITFITNLIGSLILQTPDHLKYVSIIFKQQNSHVSTLLKEVQSTLPSSKEMQITWSGVQVLSRHIFLCFILFPVHPNQTPTSLTMECLTLLYWIKNHLLFKIQFKEDFFLNTRINLCLN